MTFVDTAPSSARNAPPPRALGKFLFVGERKLEVRGVTYGTFRPGPTGASFPSPWVVSRDFARMSEAGFNAVRVYTPPPEWLLDEALDVGLRVMVGVPWEQHVTFLDDPGIVRSVEARLRNAVSRSSGHPALLCYAVGNGIPSPVVRWSGRRKVEAYLHRLYDAAKSEAPDIPVTYVNVQPTEHLDLPFLDVVAFNVFLETAEELSGYLAHLQRLADDRPLLLTALGLDSRRHGTRAQACLLEAQIHEARLAGCAGAFAFAWTDEWHRGGHDVVDSDFGLTTRDRRPKPALAAVRRAFSASPPPPSGTWPRISVAVCVHDGERWLADCLEGLKRLSYPDYEVIVVDDGSTDATGDIVARYDVESIRVRRGGLSRARNAAIEASHGEIVAFIDADARPDDEWLTHLALAFDGTDFVGIGGPTIAPPDDGIVAACAANAPGGPSHVRRTDRDAEHIRGCNMAFHRSALEAVGGFDARFRIAGDDVDICRRLQERGWHLGFAPAAVVWHHRRDSIRAFWRQELGYGTAEALLEAKWPPRSSNSRWRTAATPEWYLGLFGLGSLSVVGIAWHPLLASVPLLALGMGATVTSALRCAARARFTDGVHSPAELLRRKALVTLLHLVQPAARLTGRLLTRSPWRCRARPRHFAWPRTRTLDFWRERGEPSPRTLARVERALAASESTVRRGGGNDTWDLRVEGGSLGHACMFSCIEEHGRGRQRLRVRIRPRVTKMGWLVGGAGSCLALWSALDHAWPATLLLGGATVLLKVRSLWECGSSAAALAEAVADCEAARTGGAPRPADAPWPERSRTSATSSSRRTSLQPG